MRKTNFGLSAFVIIFVLTCVGIYVSQGMRQNTINAATIENQGVRKNWQTYRNDEAGFEIDYPCEDVACNVEEYKDSYLLSEAYLPTSDPRVTVIIGHFTEQSVKDWNTFLTKPCPSDQECEGDSFELNLEQMRDALKLPVGTIFKPKYLYSEYPGHYFTVTSINGIKAIEGSIPRSYFANRQYYILNGDKWISITVFYWSFTHNADVPVETVMVGEDFEKAALAGDEVLRTLRLK